MRNSFFLIIGFISLILISQPVSVQQSNATNSIDNSRESVEVMVLGTFHFTQVPDFYNMEAPEKQREIEKVVNQLSEFTPTKIGLEIERKDSSLVDSLYEAYRNGIHELSLNETEQIGFRLAKQMNHQKIHAIDYQKPWGMNEVMKWAQKNDQDFLSYVRNWRKRASKKDSSRLKNKTLSKILSEINSDSSLQRLQEARMRTLEVGADKNYIGVQPVSSVYERNMRIFANITAIAEPGDRILIVYGSGHAYFFRTFVQQHPDMKLIEVLNYL